MRRLQRRHLGAADERLEQLKASRSSRVIAVAVPKCGISLSIEQAFVHVRILSNRKSAGAQKNQVHEKASEFTILKH
jgi:hypothetical protein